MKRTHTYLVLDGLTLFDGNDTLLADLFHCLSNQVANMCVSVGRNGRDLGNLLAGSDGLCVRGQIRDDLFDSSLGAPPQVHGIATGGNVLDTLCVNSSGKNGGRGGAVTSNLIGLLGNILNETSTEVFKLVLQGNRLGDSDTV